MEEKILEVLKGINEEIIGYTGTNMVEDGIVDSFEIIGMVSDLEEAFDIEIDAKYVVAKNFANKDTIIELVKRLIG